MPPTVFNSSILRALPRALPVTSTGWVMKVAYTLLVAGLLTNILLPFRFLGIAVSSQRLIAVLILGLCAYLFVDDRIRWLSLTTGQKAFVSAYLVLLSTMALRLLLTGDDIWPLGMLSAILNLVLFLLVVLVLNNIDEDNLESLFRVWLPAAVTVVMLMAIGWWLWEMVSREYLDLSRFYQGYRLRSGDERNIVNPWAASLVLAVPLVWRPLLKSSGIFWKVLSAMAVGATCVTVALTFSRAALIALVFILLVGIGGPLLGLDGWGRPSRRQGLQTVAWVTVVAFLVLLLVGGLESAGVPVSVWVLERVSPVIEGSDPSVANRLKILDRSWDLALEAPLLGYATQDLAGERQPENTFLLAMHRHGVFGFVAFTAMVLWLGLELLWKWTKRESALDVAWLALFGGYVLLLATNDFLYFSMGTLTLATLTAVAARRPSPYGHPPARPAIRRAQGAPG